MNSCVYSCAILDNTKLPSLSPASSLSVNRGRKKSAVLSRYCAILSRTRKAAAPAVAKTSKNYGSNQHMSYQYYRHRQANPKAGEGKIPPVHLPSYTLSHHSLTPPAITPAKHPQMPLNKPPSMTQGILTTNAVSKPERICSFFGVMLFICFCVNIRPDSYCLVYTCS